YPELWTGDPVPPSADDAVSFRDTIASYYRWQDHRLGQLLSLADSRTVVLVVSDHGFQMSGRENVPTVSGGHMGSSPPPGFLVASGPGIRSGHRLEHASVLDIAPTVLAILGLPRAHDQPGSVLIDAMDSIPEDAWVDSYGSGLVDPSVPASSDLDKEIIQSLRAVGYTGR
ncbi:MAG: alkaline phosphatase family protein, partial [Thermoanaerobaculia bacterium]|nr:alkaline phosphatase family protein [Thermoanaerobaculia bacterium]